MWSVLSCGVGSGRCLLTRASLSRCDVDTVWTGCVQSCQLEKTMITPWTYSRNNCWCLYSGGLLLQLVLNWHGRRANISHFPCILSARFLHKIPVAVWYYAFPSLLWLKLFSVAKTGKSTTICKALISIQLVRYLLLCLFHLVFEIFLWQGKQTYLLRLVFKIGHNYTFTTAFWVTLYRIS